MARPVLRLLVVIGCTAACNVTRDRGAPPTDPPRPEREVPAWPEREVDPRPLEPAEIRPPLRPEALCPTDLPAVTVQTRDTDGGVVHDFSAAAGQVMDVRIRTRRMAEVYARHAARVGVRRARGDNPDPADRLGVAPAWPRVEDHRRGARLHLVAADAEEITLLQAHETWHGERMNLGECPLVQLLVLVDEGFGDGPDEAAPTPFDGAPP